ncbi:MAG: hypothetical protein K2K12_00520, partial [Clostridia bacterium]|nr:hypothetical protein [Clostridia bacterium]
NSNGTVSFLLKATHNFAIWLNSDSKDNTKNNSYRLMSLDGTLLFSLSSSPNTPAAVINSDYQSGEWNRFDITFATSENVTEISVSVNGEAAELVQGSTAGVEVKDSVLTHTVPSGFTTGEYFVVKVWYANDYIQLKPVELDKIPDVPVIAAIGDSITEGAGATNFYADSYPVQLQTMLGKDYNVINFGMSGRTARTDMSSYDSNPIGWIDNMQFLGVKAIVPDIAFVKLGTNDSKTSNKPATTKENFKAAYERIIWELKEINPNMTIYICTSATAYSSLYDISNTNIENIIIPVQLEVAEEYGCAVIDIHEYTKGKSKIYADTIHPSTRGYTMFAEILAQVILEGEESLTADFLADIDARYNDPV